jgi:hypothetical protein
MRTLTQRRPLPRLAACAALTLLLTACGGGDAAPTPTPAPAPAPSPAPDAPTDQNGTPSASVEVFVVRSAPTTFFVEPIPVPVATVGDTLSAQVTVAIEALLALEDTGDDELFTSVPEGTTLRGVAVDGGVVSVDLSGAIVGSSGSSAQEVTFAQQLAHTARIDDSIDAVRLLVDGQPIDELWGHLDWSEPIPFDPFILSPVTITAPLAGGTVAVGEVTFRGEATVFEATVLVTLLDADGRVVEEGFVTATIGAPERGTWEWTVTLPSAGDYTVVAEESDPSGGEGRPPFATTRTVRATG